MKPLRAFLVDDEPLALERLARLLKETGRVEVVGCATEPEAAVEALVGAVPDLCFLDIHMPRMNGFEMLQKLARQPIVIFTTAHDRYALQAFERNAVDYLLKPVAREALERALTKAEHMAAALTISPPQLRQMIRELADSWRTQPEYPARLASRLGDRIVFLDLPRVSHFYAEDKVTFGAMEGKAYCVDHSIAHLTTLLDPREFLRVHRGAVVNLSWIREVSPLPGGSLQIRLRGAEGGELTVARDRVKEFKSRVGW